MGTESTPLRAVFERIGTPVDQQSTPLTDAGKKLLRYDKSALAYILAIEIEAADLFEKQALAARERPSALDAADAAFAISIVNRLARMGSCSQSHHEHLAGDARNFLARLTEPDAGEGAERHCICQVGGYTDICPIHPDPDAGEGTEPEQFDPNLPSGARWVSGDE